MNSSLVLTTDSLSKEQEYDERVFGKDPPKVQVAEEKVPRKINLKWKP
jgi:hypothetical protein